MYNFDIFAYNKERTNVSKTIKQTKFNRNFNHRNKVSVPDTLKALIVCYFPLKIRLRDEYTKNTIKWNPKLIRKIHNVNLSLCN